MRDPQFRAAKGIQSLSKQMWAVRESTGVAFSWLLDLPGLAPAYSCASKPDHWNPAIMCPPLFCYSICHHHCPAKHLHPLLQRQHANRRLWTQALCSEASRAPTLPYPCSHLPPPVPSCTSCQCHQTLLRFLILLNWFWSQSEHQQAWPCRSLCVHQISLGLGIFQNVGPLSPSLLCQMTHHQRAKQTEQSLCRRSQTSTQSWQRQGTARAPSRLPSLPPSHSASMASPRPAPIHGKAAALGYTCKQAVSQLVSSY